MKLFQHFVNLLFYPRFTLQHLVLCAPFCEEANYSKGAAGPQEPFLNRTRKVHDVPVFFRLSLCLAAQPACLLQDALKDRIADLRWKVAR